MSGSVSAKDAACGARDSLDSVPYNPLLFSVSCSPPALCAWRAASSAISPQRCAGRTP